MKIKSLKYIAVAAVLGLGMTSCEDFLNRPTEDSYTKDNYYQTDDQCIAGVNYLYNSPWYDFQRGFFKVGEVLSGNYWWSKSPYLNFSLNSNDEDLRNMSYSLWAVNGHANTVYKYIDEGKASETVKNQTKGECLLWKAMAYFYLVRTFGEVPIIHDNITMLGDGNYNDQYKVKKEDVYEYIIMTLEKAVELLPESCTAGRLDKYCAKGLLAKVYLTKAGVSGSLNNSDLQKAAEYANDVIKNSGRALEKEYATCFKLEGNLCDENMIAWRWTTQGSQWTRQNSLQSDLAVTNMDEFGDCWGGWNGVSVDLQEAFGIKMLEGTAAPGQRGDLDTRRKATMMTAGDVISYFWRDKGGFDYLKYFYDKDWNEAASDNLESGTGANCVKHLYGTNKDHEAVLGFSAGRMASALCTPILRLADVYLVFVESKVLLGQVDAECLAAYNTVHQRAIPSAEPTTTLTFDDVWKERRLELALEGDRWYDFVRLAYYNPTRAMEEIKAQKRNQFWNLNALFKENCKSGAWNLNPEDGSAPSYDTSTPAPNVTEKSFVIPFPTEDLTFNPHLSEDAVHVDVRETFKY